ncbi:MAG: DNA repair protein RadC [Oscillospiraceae bacterium]|nr:DNA repair protein RadC [Oscillospiraceae bacterium]
MIVIVTTTKGARIVMSIHNGHRGRLREQFLDHGLDSFADHQTLELLLCYSVRQGDVNPTAHALMNHFGSLSAVFEASPQDLLEVKGIGEISMSLIRLVTELGRRYQLDKASAGQVLDSTERAGHYVLPLFHGLTDEAVYLVCLDGQRRVIHREQLAQGSVNAINFSIRRAVEVALKRKAVYVILAHNHPSGLALPNVTDIATTEQLILALAPLNLRLADHIIVAAGDFVSMRDSGHLAKIEGRLGYA